MQKKRSAILSNNLRASNKSKISKIEEDVKSEKGIDFKRRNQRRERKEKKIKNKK